MATVNEPHQPDANLARLHSELNLAHGLLLTLHKALLDHERMRYEGAHGTVRSPGELLQLVINDPWFAWLRTLSGLITQIDEFVSSRQPAPPAEGEALLTQSRRLLTTPDDGSKFQREYHRALQESPAAAHALGQWKLALSQMDRKS